MNSLGRGRVVKLGFAWPHVFTGIRKSFPFPKEKFHNIETLTQRGKGKGNPVHRALLATLQPSHAEVQLTICDCHFENFRIRKLCSGKVE